MRLGQRWRGELAATVVLAALLKLAATASAAGIIWIHLCGSYTAGSGSTGGSLGVARSGSGAAGITTPFACPPGSPTASSYGMEVFGGGSGVKAGQRGYWEVDAPAGLSIVGVHTEGAGLVSYGINDGKGWGGGFYWQGGGAQATDAETEYSSPAIDSPYFGWQIICGWSTCNGQTNPGELSVLGLEIEAAETSGPSVFPASGSLGTASGWVRGWWPVAFSADGPSGACQLAASLGGVSVSQPVNEPQSQTTWHQCSAGAFSQSFNTASVSSGASVPLVMWARDAAYDYQAGAYLSGSVTKNVNIDNAPVGISLSGPVDAPSTAGVQHVSATATAGPSGVQGITCTVDGGPAQSYAGASAQVPVSGIGSHTVRCAADNNAVDSSGSHGWSSWSSWTMTIRQPTVSGIGFSKLVDAMLCRRVHERVTVPARWVTVLVHHKPVRFKDRALRRTITVARCHPRIERRTVTVWATVTRHGKRIRVAHRKTVRVVVMPHVVTRTSKRIGHGRAATVAGWLGMPNGTALAGQPVQVMTAPDNGLGVFSQAAVAVTSANGSWVARLPAGPSRIVEAVYGGDGTLEPSTSSQVHVVVPAKVRLISVSPRHVAWDGTVRIVGQLVGGYLPPGGALVRLRLGQGAGYTTYGVQEHITGNGRFATTYTFGAGLASVHQTFWFQIASLPMGGDYPWAPADSRKLDVIVGGHPAPPARPRRHRHRRRR
ncbi:MAG: hypothetical protein ACYC91_07105 [Solirubrobacteraceae bacterium]